MPTNHKPLALKRWQAVYWGDNGLRIVTRVSKSRPNIWAREGRLPGEVLIGLQEEIEQQEIKRR